MSAPLDFAPNDERNEPFEARPIAWRLIVALLVIQVVGFSAMAWAVFVKGTAQ